MCPRFGRRRWRLATALGVMLTPLLVACPGSANVDKTGDRRAEPDAQPAVSRVVVISLDGLNPTALKRLGAGGTPVLHGMMAAGTSTMNARAAYEMTVTLPNHTSMVTGRRIDTDDRGHGVTWNDDRRKPPTVRAAAGERVESVFSTLDAAGRDTALFASKTKFSLWNRSWPGTLDQYEIRLDNLVLSRHVARDIRDHDRDLTFVHLGATDVIGHDRGWLTKPYMDAVRRADAYVGRILDAIEAAGESGETLVVVTSDHGGIGRGHTDPTKTAHYRIPFLVVGPGVPADTDLYDLNPDYRDPGWKRPTYDAQGQPVRNGAVANLVLDALGLDPVPGSQVDVEHDLDVFAPPTTP